ncbi:MAG: ThiF family adenylyltransferase [Patescibacteria group bacterium]|nr:ThiF family adenylyltransferase [Patescibacteria group bacterium]
MEKPIIVKTKEEILDINKNIKLIDTFDEQVKELRLVKDPSLLSHNYFNEENKEYFPSVWVYYPWENTAVKILEEDDYFKLRSSRNHNLITKEEGDLLKSKIIAAAGLNVGNPGVVCLALESIGTEIRLADFDPLSITNLNRFRSGLTSLGVNKAIISAQQIYEINPFLNIKLYDEGIKDDNIEDFLNEADIFIEEMDNLKLKIKTREIAKKRKVPVLMVTGNGEDVIIDVERYDLDDDLKILSGYLSDEIIKKVKNIKKGEGTFEERVLLAKDFMGVEYLDKRLINSFSQVGKSIAGIPQLAESSFLRGATICRFVKRILLKENIPSGRYKISLEGIKYENN